jgi:hypothetical protein
MNANAIDILLQEMIASSTSVAKEEIVTSRKRGTRKVAVTKAMAFPGREPMSPNDFDVAVKNTSGVMLLQEVCFQFIAWIKINEPGKFQTLSPEMSPGVLLDSCKLLSRTLRRDIALMAGEDRSNRQGMVWVKGMAGTEASCRKMRQSLESLKLQAFQATVSFALESRKLLLASREARAAGNNEKSKLLGEESLLAAAKAALEKKREISIQEVLDTENNASLVVLYEQMGHVGESETEVVTGVNMGSFNK